MTTDERLRATPVQLIQTEEGVIVARNKAIFTVQGSLAYEALYRILQTCMTKEGASREQISALFSPEEMTIVTELVTALKSRRILLPVGEGEDNVTAEEHSDVFYWAMGVNKPRQQRSLVKAHITIIGLNGVSRRMATALAEMGVANVETIDFTLLRNIAMFGKEDEPDLVAGQWPKAASAPISYDLWREREKTEPPNVLVGTCDFGGHTALRAWNRYAVAEKITFLPVTLNRGVARIGPMVIAGDTACVECLLTRENSNNENYRSLRKVDGESFSGQSLSPMLPSMPSMTGDAATLELARFFDFPWLWRKSVATDIDLVNNYLSHRKIYKIPRCQVCDAHRQGATLDIKKDETGSDSGLVQRLQQLSGVTDE